MDNPHSLAQSNRLIDEKSPYLLQHAHNPVDWQPWGEAAFAQARREDKPIFLSIGYSTCHWCHVMAHESFENADTAAVMNELFVNVKLDREERPDVDRVYMTFVQATTGSGGWPMSVWLQPDLKPIVGGTYFPPDDRYGRRGFVSICRSVAHAWVNDRDKVTAQGERILAALRDHAAPGPAGISTSSTGLPSAEALLRDAWRPLAMSFDPQWGGFGDAPKFPRPVTLSLLARIQSRLGTEVPLAADAREALLITLDRMAAGGMYDHLGGGFHRYSVDRFWHVPHFEKMLYDQAQLVCAYLDAYGITGNASYADVAHGTLGYVARDLLSPEGGFYCAEDADSLLASGGAEHAEGAFYVWTRAEVESLLSTGEAALFCEHYEVRDGGNTPDGSDPQGEFTGKNILFARHPLEATARRLSLEPDHAAGLLASAREKLFEKRLTRPRPHLDDKIITAWNGLMISAFSRASQVLDDPHLLETACRAADFIRDHLYRESDKTLLRSYRRGPAAVEAFADDYAFLIAGLLDLYEAGFDTAHLTWAEELQRAQDERFADLANGGYFAASGRDPSVLLRIKEDHDGAEPSANSVAAINLVRLAALTGNDELARRAQGVAAAFGAMDNPARTAQTMPLMLVAVDGILNPPRQIVIVGERAAADTRALLRELHRRYVPGNVVMLIDNNAARNALAKGLPYLGQATMRDGKATAYLCEHGACQLPATDPVEFGERLWANPSLAASD